MALLHLGVGAPAVVRVAVHRVLLRDLAVVAQRRHDPVVIEVWRRRAGRDVVAPPVEDERGLEHPRRRLRG